VSERNTDDSSYFPSFTQKGVDIFISYARRDQNLCDQLEDHLSSLKYRGLITTWTAKEISAGEEILQQIDIHLNAARIILLLISASFLASEYCYSQMVRAIQRHEYGEANVIPVLLRPVIFTDTPFARLWSLPSNGKPVTTWRDRDKAFVDIVIGIERIVQEGTHEAQTSCLSSPLPLPYRKRPEQEYYEEALAAYERALRLNNTDATAYRGKGNALVGLGRYYEALMAFGQAVALLPTPLTYVHIGDVLVRGKYYDEAVASYRQALTLDASYASAYTGMREAFLRLGRVQEAKQAYEQAKRIDEEN
jgi:tetratricopeptide (TPR) repeat protein